MSSYQIVVWGKSTTAQNRREEQGYVCRRTRPKTAAAIRRQQKEIQASKPKTGHESRPFHEAASPDLQTARFYAKMCQKKYPGHEITIFRDVNDRGKQVRKIVDEIRPLGSDSKAKVQQALAQHGINKHKTAEEPMKLSYGELNRPTIMYRPGKRAGKLYERGRKNRKPKVRPEHLSFRDKSQSGMVEDKNNK